MKAALPSARFCSEPACSSVCHPAFCGLERGPSTLLRQESCDQCRSPDVLLRLKGTAVTLSDFGMLSGCGEPVFPKMSLPRGLWLCLSPSGDLREHLQ